MYSSFKTLLLSIAALLTIGCVENNTTSRREWRDLDTDLFFGNPPSAQEIEQWKAEFEEVNPYDSIQWLGVDLYKDTCHYLAVSDFIEFIHGPKCDEYVPDDRRLLWRLDQYDPLVNQKPKMGLDKVLFLRDQYERLLDYECGSQWDMTMWSWLSTDFRDLYGRLLDSEIMKQISPEVSELISAEIKCEGDYYDASSLAYQKIEGSPGWSGSAFPYRVGCFGILNIDIGNMSKEELVRSLYDPSYATTYNYSLITKKLLTSEYARFAGTFEEEEYWYPVKERKDALNNDRDAFFKWMDARSDVSSHLTGRTKTVYDNSTQSIMRQKLIILKNRFNQDDGFCTDDITKHLLDNNCTDEELMAHNLEQLLEL